MEPHKGKYMKKIKNIPAKTLNQLNKLTLRGAELDTQKNKEIADAQKFYGIGDNHFNYDFDNFTDNDREFDITVDEIYARYEHAYQTIQAKWMALFLIATNIARRGKPLHPDTAKKKLQKYRDNGKKISYILDTPVCPMVLNSGPFLARELYKTYGVVLMDEYLAKHVTEGIYFYSYLPWPAAKKLRHYKNFLKKFHKSVLESKRSQWEYEPF